MDCKGGHEGIGKMALKVLLQAIVGFLCKLLRFSTCLTTSVEK